jgi:hypothetical protein
MPYGYDNGRRARIGVVGVGCCRDEARLADHCVWWGGFTSGPKALLLYTVIRQSTLHYHSKTRITPHITSPLYQIHPSPLLFSVHLDFICGKSRGPTSRAPLIQKCRVLKAKYKLHSSSNEGPISYEVCSTSTEHLCESARGGSLFRPSSSLNPAFNSAFQRSRSPPALPAHGNFKGTCSVRPLGIPGSAAESQ